MIRTLRMERPGTVDHVHMLLAHLRLKWLLQHFPARVVSALYVFINGFITIGLLAFLALLTDSPFSSHRSAELPACSSLFSVGGAFIPRDSVLGHAIVLVYRYPAFSLTVASSPPFGLIAVFMAPGSSPLRFRCRLRVRLWRCSRSAIRRRSHDPHRFARHHLPTPENSSLLKSRLSCLRPRLSNTLCLC